MAEEKEKKAKHAIKQEGHPEGCMCMGCKALRVGGICSCGCRTHSLYYRVLRTAILLVILGFVFCFGVKVGRVHELYDMHYGGIHTRIMGGYYGSGDDVFYYGGSNRVLIQKNIPAATSSLPKSSTTKPEQM